MPPRDPAQHIPPGPPVPPVPPVPQEVDAVFSKMPDAAGRRLRDIRALIFDVAAVTQGVGPLSETLKWGQPAYLTSKSKSGSTLRIGTLKGRNDKVALFVNCQTILADTFRERIARDLLIEGNRAVLVPIQGTLPEASLRECIALTLTYHRWRARR